MTGAKSIERMVKELEGNFKYAHPVDLHLEYLPKTNFLVIHKIVVDEGERRKGVASCIMYQLVDLGRHHGLNLALTPSSSLGTPTAYLKGFYQKFGFRFNKGWNRDHRTFEEMIIVND